MSRRAAAAAVALLLGLPGCAQLLGFEDVEAVPVQDAGAGDATAQVDAGAQFLECAQAEFSPALGTVTGSNEATPNERDLSCGSANANDLLLAWTAPVTDYYVFSTENSDFDTVLGLFDGCEGEELACNNNVGNESSSEVVLKVEQDKEVLVAVDGFATDTGNVSLDVARVTCPDSDLGGQTFPLSLTSTGFGDDFSNACGGEGHPDRAYHYVAPEDGLYAFSAVGETHSPIITVIDGSRCEDTELGCSRAAEPGFLSEVVRRLSAGQEVSVYVDGRNGEGNFDIDIQQVDATCPASSIGQGQQVIGSFGPRTMSSSCSFPERRNTINVQQELGDATFLVEVGAAGLGCNGSCSLRITSEGEFRAALLENGDCSGAELTCLEGVDQLFVPIQMDEVETKEHTLIISDAFHGDSSSFTVEMFCNIACA